jgi:hypothetical protein
MRTRLATLVLLAACSKSPTATKAADTKTADTKPAAAKTTETASHLGTPIAATAPAVSLGEIMKNPTAYKGKEFVTTGTVTAVCQEMGCWMEIKDDSGEAHIKMAGEKFYVPKTSAGHKARVQGTLVDVAGGDEDCAKEAATQTGKQVAKVQLEATGVELD